MPGPGTTEHVIRLKVPAAARPGRYWLLVKAMGAGQIVYSPAVALTVAPAMADAR